MKVVAFISNYEAVDRIICHLKLTFVPWKPPPPAQVFEQVARSATEAAHDYSS
jgi:hypothetical protein